MTLLTLPSTDLPDEVPVDGLTDGPGIEYWGIAKRQLDGTYQCLANVHGSLCRVEIRLRRLDMGDGESRY
jgi:hypothetical protein